MYNKKVTSILLSTIIASSTSLGITPSNINVFADGKQVCRNNLNENFSLDMGEYKNDNGILCFPNAKGVIKGKSNLLFNFDGENNVKVSYTKNGSKMEGITYEPSLKSRVINIIVENQEELDEVLKTLKIKCDGNVNFSAKLTSMPTGTITSNGIGQEEAIDGNLNSHFRSNGQGWWQLLFDEEMELDIINLTFGRKNGAEIQGLKNGTWIKIGEAEDYPIDLYSRETQSVKVNKGIYSGIKVIPKVADDNMSRLCEISFDKTVPQNFKYNANTFYENLELNLGKFNDNNGILSFPSASGKLKEATYLRFDFNRNAYNDVTVLYTLNSQEESITGKNVKIPIKNQIELDEVLKSLKINTNGNKKLGFTVLLGGLPILKSVEGKPSRLYKPERAIDGNNDTFYGAINQNNSTFTILFEDKTYIENILIKANKNFTIEGLKDNVWKTIGNSTTDSIEINGKKKINVETDTYDGIIIKQKHSGVDSCTINEIEFNNGSVEEKINYNSNVCSLDLGNKVVNEDGSISFEDFNAKGNEVKLLINFEKDSDKNKISYMQNEQAVEKKGDCEIDVNNETELNEILESIKIYHDNNTENDVTISLLTSNENSIENVPKGVIAEGGASDNVHTAENVFSGSNSFFISNSSNTLTLKNTKDIYLNGVAFLNGNAQISIKGLKNGLWKNIGIHNSNDFEMINLISGYYDEIKFVSNSTLDIRNLYMRYSDIKEEIKLDIIKNNLNLGNYKIENNKITFPEAKGVINGSCKLKFKFNNIEKQDTSIKYILNGKEIIKYNQDTDIEITTQTELREVLRSLEINFSKLKGCFLEISLVEEQPPIWGVPVDVIGKGKEYNSMNSAQQAFKGGYGWNSGSFNDVMYVSNIDNVYLSAIRYCSKNNLRIKGKTQDDKWVTIGDTTPNTSMRQVDIIEGYYKELELCSYGADWSHISNLEFLMNDNRKSYTKIDIEASSLNIDNYSSDGEGNVTFPNCSSNINDKSTLDIEFKKGYNGVLSTSYTLNGVNKNSKESKISIQVLNNKELKEVLDSLKIKHDNTANLKLTFSLNLSNGEKIEKDIDVATDDKLNMGEMQYSKGKITFPNANGKIRDKADLNFSSRTDLEVKYISDGKEIIETGKNIVIKDLTQLKLDELLKSISISYKEYEGCEFSISLLCKPITITKNYSIPQAQGNLELILGEYENDGNGNVIFPNAKGSLYRAGSLNLSFDKGFSNDIEIKYKLNDTEYTKKQNNLSISISNQNELDEVLNTLKIKCNSNLEYNLNITLAENGYIPIGTTSDKPQALNGSGWYCGNVGSTATITFNSPLKISTISLTKTSGVDNKFRIKGLKNGIWTDVGSFIPSGYDYLSTREIDIQRDSYDKISISYSVASGWGSANVSKVGFLDKVSSNIKIKPDVKLKVSLADNLEKANLKWNSNLEAYAYNIYVKKKEDKNWTLSKTVTSDINEMDDYEITDSKAPALPTFEIQKDGIKKGIQLKTEDIGTEYSYYINAINENGDRIGTSNIEKIFVQSDFKEFSYEVSNNPVPASLNRNSTNGFIPFRELVDKNYLHVAALDNFGNMSEIKTIQILKLFIDEAPILTIPGDISLKQNSSINILEGVNASDEIDGDLTSKITTEITGPAGTIVENINTEILGKWTIKYSVEDSKKQVTEYIRTINIIKDIPFKLNVGEILVTSTFVKFPNSKIITNDSSKEIDGIKIYFSDEFNNSMKIHYELNGVENTTTDRNLDIQGKFTIKEAEELIKSIKIDTDNSTKFKFNIILDSNNAEKIIYNYKNNHYYKLVENVDLTLEEAKLAAKKQEMLGCRGTLATIDEEYKNILTKDSVWTNDSTENINHKGFIVEFGEENEKLPSPDTVVNLFEYESIINIEPFKSKQDIVLNTLVDKKENKVILDWNDVKDVSYYKVFQKKNDIGDFKVISSDKNESYFEDVEGKDVNEPTAPTHKLYDTGIKQGIKFDSEDIGSKFEYYVEGISKYGDVTHTSNKKMIEIKSGLEGFSYEVSDSPTPSSNLGNTINSTDGFISAKELASKNYIHIVTIDKVGNKRVVTLPILGIFTDYAPILNIGGNTSISKGSKFDVMGNVSAIDDYDGDLTKDINIVIKNPDGAIVDSIDTNILGKWTLEYFVADNKGQESRATKYITVKESFDYLSIDLGEPDIKRFLSTFPNVRVTNNSGELIDGVKLYISEGFNNNIIIKYNDKGIEKSVKGQQVILTDKYTTKEIEDLIKSIKIEHDNSTSFKFNVRLQNNTVDDIVYNPENGSYYQFVEAKRITWKNAKKEAENMEYKGLKGHLATISSPTDLDIFNSLTSKTVWLDGTDEVVEGEWRNVKGELFKWTNWAPGEPNNFDADGEDYLVSIKNSNGLWNDASNSPNPVWTDIEGFVVEFENEKNENVGGSYKYEDSVYVENIVSNKDIVISANANNKENYIDLSWNKYNEASYYVIERKKIGDSKSKYIKVSGNKLKDLSGQDLDSPNMFFSFVLNKEMSAKLQFDCDDLESEYEYSVKAYDLDDYEIAHSNMVKTSIKTGLKGYSYILDKNSNTEILGDVNNTDGNFEFKGVSEDDYLHIVAIDNAGNRTKTKHIKLSDDSHNNAPILKVPGLNQVLEIGTTFDKLKNVTAYDMEDGDLTSKITVQGDINNQVQGVYELKYSVQDSKGLKAEELVKVHVPGNVKLDIKEFEDKLNLTWEEVKDADKYIVYKTDANGFDFREKGIFSTTEFTDTEAKDVSSPVITYLNEVSEAEEAKNSRLASIPEKTTNTGTKLKLVARDLSSTYRYFIEAIDKNGNVINSSKVRNGSVESGLAGFNYVIDGKEDTEAANFVNAKKVEDIDISSSKFKFLHVRAVDRNGNVSKTYHHLIGGKYDTNHIPVIRNVYTARVKEGSYFDPLDNISAYDTEDGDLTSKIEVSGNVDTNINGEYELNYHVEDSQGNIRDVKRKVVVYGDMEIKVEANLDENNLVVSWDENKLGDKVFYEVRKLDKKLNVYKTIGYTEDLSFVDENAKDVFGPEVKTVHGSDMDTKELEDEITLDINPAEVGDSEKYQVRTRLKDNNLIIRDMTTEEGHEWGTEGHIVGYVKAYKYKLSNKREDTLKTGILTTSLSPNQIVFEHKGNKYIHFMPIDSFGNEGDVIHYQIGKIDSEEEILTPPVISAYGVPVLDEIGTRIINVGDNFNVLDGITAKDFRGEDLTEYIKVEGYVNRFEAGEYDLKYSVTDFKGQSSSKNCKVIVQDYKSSLPNKPDKSSGKPEAILWDEEYITVGDTYGEDRIRRGVKVIDPEDGDLTDKITYETDLDNNTVGSYFITYTVSDTDDNRIRFSRIVHVLEKGEDIPENSEDIGDWENTRWPQLEVRDVYLCVGDDFNIKSGLLYAYDEVDGYLTNKVKSSGTVNTIKEGVYSVSYKVTNSDNRTSIRSAAVLVREGGWNNGEGQLPDPGPDWGENDDNDEHNNHIPNKPEQPEQPDDNNDDDKLPGIDDDANQGGQDDYYIDKDGNKVFPDGSIVTPGDVEIKPNPDGEKPTINDDGNIIVPPGGIIILPDGTIQIPEDGAILKPDGVIIYPKENEKTKDEEIKNKENNSKEESSNSISSLINNDKIEKETSNSNIDKINPPTGDRGVGIFWGLGILSTICLIFNRRKNK
ncbi:immunoglobulin-like domain-containing protein [Clostridioides difficile]|uniref:immunoglobulin-like domain-containing protein n=1 Tax=Clostridioides difficile TaxID=1496 RepID=UPI0021C65905|nr:immunoglobulin-like domain-containing protein [Clostridioides difficile]UUV16700.1 DUF5011 domain-containing protein [Clostridioides difficile]